MIFTIITFPGVTAESTEKATELFATSSATYLGVRGLLGKAYLRHDDGTLGAVYWWTNRADAEARFNDGWLAGVTEKYGSAPIIQYCDAPVVVDNVTGTIRMEPPQVFGGQETL